MTSPCNLLNLLLCHDPYFPHRVEKALKISLGEMQKIYFPNASLIFERKCLLHICMNNIYMLLSTKHLFSKLNGLVDSCHGLKIWHIHFPKGCALVDHGTHISDLSIFVCLQCTHTATKEVRVKHGIAKCLTKGSIELHIL